FTAFRMTGFGIGSKKLRVEIRKSEIENSSFQLSIFRFLYFQTASRQLRRGRWKKQSRTSRRPKFPRGEPAFSIRAETYRPRAARRSGRPATDPESASDVR